MMWVSNFCDMFSARQVHWKHCVRGLLGSECGGHVDLACYAITAVCGQGCNGGPTKFSVSSHVQRGVQYVSRAGQLSSWQQQQRLPSQDSGNPPNQQRPFGGHLTRRVFSNLCSLMVVVVVVVVVVVWWCGGDGSGNGRRGDAAAVVAVNVVGWCVCVCVCVCVYVCVPTFYIVLYCMLQVCMCVLSFRSRKLLPNCSSWDRERAQHLSPPFLLTNLLLVPQSHALTSLSLPF